MPRERQKPERALTSAEKQRAYRERQEAQGSRIRGLLWRLDTAVWKASDSGDPLAERVKASDVETMIERLAEHFEGIGGKPDA